MSLGEGGSVLVVDDEPDVAEAYAEQLSDRHAVETVYSGEAALSALSPSIDVVLLDRRMPGVSGDEVLEAIRDRAPGVRVAIVSAVQPDFDIVEMPFDDYVVKPVPEAELNRTVERLVRCSAYWDRLREYYALTAKRAALTASKSTAELAASEAVSSLDEDIDAVETDLYDIAAGFDTADYERVFADIGRPAEAGHTG